MKRVKLFEGWIEDLAFIGDEPKQQSTPSGLTELASQLDFGSNVVGNDVLNANNEMEQWYGTGKHPWMTALKQKLKSFGFKSEETKKQMFWRISNTFELVAVRGKDSVYLYLTHRVSDDKWGGEINRIIRQDYYGTFEETTDAIAAALTDSKNLKIFKELKKGTPKPVERKKSKSLESLTNDKVAVSIHKKLQDISIVNDAESVARGILIQTLYYVTDAESGKAGIETVINTLNKYLGDKDYLDRLKNND
jgi:hypothetical protein